MLALAVLVWDWWSARYPEQERALRVQLQSELETRFPEAMRPDPQRYGIFPGTADTGMRSAPGVLLVHGLDEPGGIWSELMPALETAGFETWEFRYPNDQGIDRSADLLASRWFVLPADRPMVLIGHSMGGLVIRDFVSRWRHPVDALPGVEGAPVIGVILAGTPNQGSEWARLRVLLESRDQWAGALRWGFDPLSGLRDGTGAAKIDLQPGSRFLADLNQRPWPPAVALQIIGGLLTPAIEELGDGVVSMESLVVAGAPPPLILFSSHRGMLVRLFESDGEPPAIPIILSQLEALRGAETERSGSGPVPGLGPGPDGQQARDVN